MTGDELRERVIAATGPVLNRSGFDVYPETVTEAADAAIRVVLTVVADDLNEHALWIQFAFRQSAFADLASDREKSAITQQWRDAAEHVRSLLPKEASND